MFSRSSHTRILIPVLALVVLSGCQSVERDALPELYANEATVLGRNDLRCFEDQFDVVFGPSVEGSFENEDASLYKRDEEGNIVYPILSLSSGGSDGAFGVGLLNGWTECGRRPNFKIVSGISTGALIAPFAFLGCDHDGLLKELYTGVTADDVAETKNPLAIFYSDSLASNEPLVELVKKHVDGELLQCIAREHLRGRRLYVGTTNLDLQRLVIWDMGAIACSEHPDSLKLFREVLLASSAIPVVFPPVYLKVQVDGKTYDELHVDGSVRSLLFLPEAMMRRMVAPEREKVKVELFIVRNGQLNFSYEAVEPTVSVIAMRTILTLLQSMARAELESLYLQATKLGVGFNVTSIPNDYQRINKAEFDQAEMRRLFDIGLQIGSSENAWQHAPPGYLDPIR